MQSNVLVRDLYAARRAAGRPVVSFEFFPPKTADGERGFFDRTLPQLAALKPDYCSVTYGAGGSTRDKTLALVEAIQQRHQLPAMAHLTCVGSTEAQIREIIAQARARGIHNILALRGDPPAGESQFQQTAGGFEYAWQLVQLLREAGDFSIAVAGFPEGHPACHAGRHVDWERLREKIAYGADLVITQLFFDNRLYFEFRDFLAKQGVTIPLVPGILPILNVTQIKKITLLCGATIPPALLARLEELAGDDAASTEFGIEYSTRQCEELLRAGAPGIHFYTLNKVRSTTRILQNLGLV
ncbi:MAG TPA: methylenetetrahydrofolate reductase [NAD(P)H] [Verrucomicrobiota bacterium]|jgi:methylenetetrahydrofolate reductase (NADPH)|nr:methylenetetrahydrofolate reductase [NAD(P)H] [Verrucomicrobiota bacterium]OQB92659.1 MAG: 5,10-methylenetetrahydrofolate reductase [Verrucomicrobia bacterium ADurb.Bin118]HPY29318.1 methylenetetrahydrofolate reductase [NAD(P)H] [Verrucomicrobiota bacterium]HQB15109.1 methylenetetrahydrofolate reductase [NAD(P)H] [Verrucomicrobiota bacterium]